MNLAVTHIMSPEPFVIAGRQIVFEATLRQFGTEPRQSCTVELNVDDVPVGEQTADVPAGGETTVRFTHRFTAPGNHAVTVRAQSDQLAIDDSRILIVPVREEIRVLCVAGREGAARYVADALDPNPTAPSAIRPVVVSEADLAETQLTDFDCVFLCNVALLTASEAQRLTRFAEVGGGVVLFLGDRVIPTSYNAFVMESQALVPDVQRAGSSSPPADPVNSAPPTFLPARIGPLIAEPQFGLDPLDYRHPIVAPFRGRERAGLLTTPVSRYYELDTSQGPRGVEVVAATRRGDPFIVAAPLGRGRAVLIATDGSLSSIDPTSGEPWTTWPTWPSFLPIVRELLAYALSGKNRSWQQSVGTSLTGTAAHEVTAFRASTGPPNQWQMVRSDGRSEPVAWYSHGGAWSWSYADTNLSGKYTLRDASQNQLQEFAVNFDPAESDLAKLQKNQLPPSIDVRTTARDGVTGDATSLVTKAVWSGWLLWLAVALMLVESFLAWRFGRGSA
jgi:hypothetical protein